MGQQQSQYTAEPREQNTFNQQLSNDAQPMGTQRSANGLFPLPRFDASQLQVGHVGTANQQEETHRHQKQVQGRAELSHVLLMHERNAGAHLAMIGLMLLPASTDDGLHLRL